MLRQKPRLKEGTATSKRHNDDAFPELSVYCTHAPSANADPGSGSLTQRNASTFSDDPLVIFDRILKLVAQGLPKHNEAIRHYRNGQYRESAQSLNEALALAKEAQFRMFVHMVAVCCSKTQLGLSACLRGEVDFKIAGDRPRGVDELLSAIEKTMRVVLTFRSFEYVVPAAAWDPPQSRLAR
ncbi:hypothetical protein DL769_000643 [Monosporascus sp. CRB-8-3]|nr:hypothetical protein DL769_000643 [Monosporascus sp. CRB-8-3]